MAELRSYLVDVFTEFDERSQAGIISDFSRSKFSTATAFARIGGGSIGGKARGLAFVSALLKRHNVRDRFSEDGEARAWTEWDPQYLPRIHLNPKHIVSVMRLVDDPRKRQGDGSKVLTYPGRRPDDDGDA